MLLQPSPTPPEASFTPEGPAVEVAGLDAADTERSLMLSPGVKPNPKGEGRGVVDRLFKAGFGAWEGPVCWAGRDPMGPTEPMGPAFAFEFACREDGESAPGDGAEATGCSPNTGLIPELGEEVLFAREGDWMPAGPALA